VNAAHANVIHDKKERRDTGALAAGAGFGGAGLGGAVATVEGAGESSLLIEISQ